MRALPAVADRAEDAAQALVLDELGVTRGEAHVGFRQHHLHVGERRGEQRPALGHLSEQCFVLERGERVADAVPAGQHHPRLRPAEHPGDRAQILDPVGLGAARRAAADLQAGDLGDRGHLAEEGAEAFRAIDEVAIGVERGVGQPVHRRGEGRVLGVGQPLGLEAGEQGGGRHRFEVRHGGVAGAVFARDHLALLGDADAALDRARWLRADRREGGAAAAPDRPAAAVEELHADSRRFEHRLQRGRGLRQRPGGGEVTPVLVRVRIADHHFLIAAGRDDRGDLGQREIGLHDAGARLQILDRLEQRHRHDRAGGGAAGPVEADLLQQQMDLEQVADRLAHRDDVIGDARRAVGGVRVGRGLRDGELGRGLVGISGEAAGERPGVGKLATEQGDARILVEAGVVGLDPGDLEQLGDDALVDRGVLAEVERGEMEAEGLNAADQPPELTAAGERAAGLAALQRVRDGHEIGAERLGVGVRLAGERAGARRGLAGQLDMRRGEARVDAGQRAAIGLVAAARRAVAARLGEAQDGGIDNRMTGRDRQFRAQRMKLVEIMAEHRFGRLGERDAKRVGGDIGVAVTVAADPAARTKERRYARAERAVPALVERG